MDLELEISKIIERNKEKRLIRLGKQVKQESF
ncbi:MAG: hypothetical protein BWY78_00822 [Alphaproteobacteria bacterium ADurb.Bin438]|nr:MAG: hypothetical protein BWY78_00822 [Alphaproteobacteria bacterium ADurb.Bin438]